MEDKNSPPPPPNERVQTEQQREIGHGFFAKLEESQVTPNLGGIKRRRGIESSRSWSIKDVGKIPGPAIFKPAQENVGYVSNTIYELTNEKGVRALGITFEASALDGIRNSFFYEVTEAGEITAYVSKGSDDNPKLEPQEINYDAMSAFIDRIRPSLIDD